MMLRSTFLIASLWVSAIYAEGQLPFVNGRPFDKPEAPPVKTVELGLPKTIVEPPLPEVKASTLVSEAAPVESVPAAVEPAPVIPEPPALVEPPTVSGVLPTESPREVASSATPAETPPSAEAPAETPVNATEVVSAPPASEGSDGMCNYVVKKGDNLSRILLRLGMLPIYGEKGNLRSVVEKNSQKVRNEGNLIFPNVRLQIPRTMVASSEMCVEGEEKNIQRRIALYSAAEAELRKGRYSRFCERVKAHAMLESRPDYRGRYMHLAAVCQYEEGNLPAAHRLWEQVLESDPDVSLKYRALYNLALVECQTEHASIGYDRLRGISADLWQSQANYERRTFLDLAVYCAERGVGAQARLDTLMGVYLTSPEPELRAYAEEKLRGDFVNPSVPCDLLDKTCEKLTPDTKEDEFRSLLKHRCG